MDYRRTGRASHSPERTIGRVQLRFLGLLDIFLATCVWTRIYFTWRPNLPDEADNHLVELAVAGGARFIVTRNLRDIARMELKFPELRVVSPEDFLKEITS
jgi:predicted nucleic acid-binding protein